MPENSLPERCSCGKSLKGAKRVSGGLRCLCGKISTINSTPTAAAQVKIQKKPKVAKETPVKEIKTSCKYYYRGGLCANSKINVPFCPGLDKCPEDVNNGKSA